MSELPSGSVKPNKAIGYFVLFPPQYADEAEGLARDLPPGWTALEVTEPGIWTTPDDPHATETWRVVLAGPEADPEEGEREARRLARSWGGDYDGWEELPDLP
jgi:hypothetical protein